MDPVYWVLIASLLVWGGLFLYLWAMDGRVRNLERRIGSEEQERQ